MEYDIFREKLALKYSAHGHALWKPNPGEDNPAVEIGDVGFIRKGHFHRLFNVLPPRADGPNRGRVPPNHKPFKIGDSELPLTHTDTLQSNHYYSNGVSMGFESLRNVPDEHSFSCSTGQGAILCLPVSAQCEDILAMGELGNYMLKHIEEWFKFARSLGMGIARREDLILVTGRHLAKSWANIVFKKDRDVTFEVRVTGDSQIEWKFTLRGASGVAHAIGPSGNLKDLPENQCIFVRGFRATRIKRILPRLVAAAGPVQVPSDDDLDADMQLISIPADTRYEEPFYTLLKYIAFRAPDCDLALIHDDDLQRCIDDASLDSLQPDTFTNFLLRSAPKVWQVESDCSPTFHGDSTADSDSEALPQAAGVKVAMLLNREVKHLDSEPGSPTPVASVDTDRPPTPSTPEPIENPIVIENPPPIVPPSAPQPNRDNRNTDDLDGVLRLEDSSCRDDTRYASITIPIPKAILRSPLFISSLAAVERRHITSIFTILFVEWCFLKLVGWPYKDILSAIFLTSLLGRFVYPVWANLKRLHCELDDMFRKIEVLQQVVNSLESNTVVRLPVEYIPVSATPVIHTLFPKEEPVITITDSPPTPYNVSTRDEGVQLEGFRDNIAEVADAHPPVVPPVVIRDPPTVPPATLQPHPGESVKPEGFDDNIVEVPDARPPPIPPVVIKDPPPPSVPPATLPPDRIDGVFFGGWDNIMEDLEAEQVPVTPSVVNPTPSVPSTSSGHDRDGGVQLKGMVNIAGASDAPNARNSSEQLTLTNEGNYNRSLPLLRGIKQQLEQATASEGKIERIPHPDQSFISLSIPRWAMRLLMSAASLVPSAFAPHSGFFGAVESTPYYPTGDVSRHRDIAFSTAMDCIDDLGAYIPGGDDVRIATKLVTLAQALSDLGLHDYALTTSGFALYALQRPHTTEPNNTRLHIASVLSLRANILCDLKKNDEANYAARRAVTLCREHKNPQTAPVPELAYALLNYAVILNAIDLKEGSAAVAFELLGKLDESRPDTKDVLALCKLCVSTSYIGTDDDMATSMADETIDSTRMSLDVNSQIVLAGALLAKSKALSSKDQNDAASTVSAEAVTLLRNMSMARPVLSLFLAHALDTHAHHLSGADRKWESYSVRQDAVEHWQMLKATAGGAVSRPLAWSLFELSKFRRKGADRQALREEFRIAECAVETFREAEPQDAPGLGDALYLYADRMLELDKTQGAATYAEESVIYFQEAASKDPKYGLDLIFSLSLASACLACTERDDAAFGYAKQAVEVQRGRRGVGAPQYDDHLRKLLMDVVFRATEMDRPDEAAPLFEELQSLGWSDGPLARRGGGQGEDDRFRKQTSFWMDATTDPPRSNNGSTISSTVASSSTLRVDKGKRKEVAPSPEAGNSTPRVDKGKAKEVNLPFDSSGFGHLLADEKITSPGVAAAAQRRLAGLGNTGSVLGGMGSGMGMGGGLDGLGSSIKDFSGSRPESSSGSSSTPQPGTRSGTGI